VTEITGIFDLIARVASNQQTLEEAMIYRQSSPVGIAAAALALLMQGKTDIVRNFLTQMVELQNCRKQMDCFQPGQGLRPASFKVEGEKIIPDFGESAIARVTPVDSCFWWLFILRAYVKATNDWTLAYKLEFQNAIRRRITPNRYISWFSATTNFYRL